MRMTIRILCLASLVLAAPVQGQGPPATQPAGVAALQPAPAAVDRLIAQLADESWRVRDEAQFRLVRLGESVRPRLEQLVSSARDEEARSRAIAILQQLERERTTGVSRVLINARQAAAADVFAELARQAHTQVYPVRPDLWARPMPKIDLELTGEPFWAGILAACEKSGLHIAGQDDRLVITDEPFAGQSPGRAPRLVSGAFLLAVTQINRNQSLDLNNANNVRRSCNLQLLVFPEPKLNVLQASHAAALVEAVDEKGNSLLNPSMSQYQSFQPMQNLAWAVQCYLLPPAEAGRKIARLRGSVSFVIQTRGESAEIEDIASQKNLERVTGGRRFVFKELARSGNDYIVRMTVFRLGWEQNEWNTLYNTQMFRLYDAEGQPLRRQRVSPKGATAESMELEIFFQRVARADGSTPGEPARLAWDVAIETQAIDVPFDFKDLPLP